ncbi:hypothetical protein KI387_007370, partial [Taxus chinensis]
SEKDQVWTMEFDGSHSKAGSGAGVVLYSPSNVMHPFAYKLQFDNTNNTTEYEALLLGISEAEDMGIKKLRCLGDAEVIVKQICQQYQ